MHLFNRIKTQNFQFISNSHFTQKWLKKWGVSSTVIHPYIADAFIKTDIKKLNKDKMILVVGRFFPHLHSKRHDIAIDWFKDLQEKSPKFKDYTLHLVGSVKEEDQLYFHDLQNLAGDNTSIHFHPNIPFDELLAFYQKSKFYWHFAGYEVDEEKHPEKTEHLGITPLEAMASGCMTFAYNAGGPKELIMDGENGYLFKSQDELLQKMNEVQRNKEKKEMIIHNAKNFVESEFSYKTFRRRVKKVLL